ncbi:unnamed protein product [Paramecium sonneborni]|uniref:Uncharacterized protein n=1 Tax=Paramecium sonneborni TaxID=65129 RepID=A0A8S1RKN6_9CILI|nr:unnamed protein product [Paramecium sonneborni]
MILIKLAKEVEIIYLDNIIECPIAASSSLINRWPSRCLVQINNIILISESWSIVSVELDNSSVRGRIQVLFYAANIVRIIHLNLRLCFYQGILYVLKYTLTNFLKTQFRSNYTIQTTTYEFLFMYQQKSQLSNVYYTNQRKNWLLLLFIKFASLKQLKSQHQQYIINGFSKRSPKEMLNQISFKMLSYTNVLNILKFNLCHSI